MKVICLLEFASHFVLHLNKFKFELLIGLRVVVFVVVVDTVVGAAVEVVVVLVVAAVVVLVVVGVVVLVVAGVVVVVVVEVVDAVCFTVVVVGRVVVVVVVVVVVTTGTVVVVLVVSGCSFKSLKKSINSSVFFDLSRSGTNIHKIITINMNNCTHLEPNQLVF